MLILIDFIWLHGISKGQGLAFSCLILLRCFLLDCVYMFPTCSVVCCSGHLLPSSFSFFCSPITVFARWRLATLCFQQQLVLHVLTMFWLGFTLCGKNNNALWFCVALIFIVGPKYCCCKREREKKRITKRKANVLITFTFKPFVIKIPVHF